MIFYLRAWFRQTRYIVIMTTKGSTKIVNFITPGARVLELGCSHAGKMDYFFENLPLYSKIRQTEYTVLKSKGGSTKIAEFFDPEGRCEG